MNNIRKQKNKNKKLHNTRQQIFRGKVKEMKDLRLTAGSQSLHASPRNIPEGRTTGPWLLWFLEAGNILTGTGPGICNWAGSWSLGPHSFKWSSVTAWSLLLQIVLFIFQDFAKWNFKNLIEFWLWAKKRLWSENNAIFCDTFLSKDCVGR